jgi:two-component system chemotaxis response regulator CheY
MAWNILIVDDSSLTRKRIRRIIEMAGLETGQFLDAENGAEALKILEKSNVNLVLSDLNMPEMSGAEMVYPSDCRFYRVQDGSDKGPFGRGCQGLSP